MNECETGERRKTEEGGGTYGVEFNKHIKRLTIPMTGCVMFFVLIRQPHNVSVFFLTFCARLVFFQIRLIRKLDFS